MGGTERGGSAGKKVAVAVVLTVVEGEDELRDSLLATRQAEVKRLVCIHDDDEELVSLSQG